VTVAIFAMVIRHEERALAKRFPSDFALYKARVPRLAPDFRGWHDAEILAVRPALVHRTFWDATLFLLAVPVLKGLESVRDAVLTGPIFRLY
jgi:hypothetical protein